MRLAQLYDFHGKTALIHLGFVASPQDLDSALMFLAHNEHSAYMTGTNITVDGGKSWGVTSW